MGVYPKQPRSLPAVAPAIAGSGHTEGRPKSRATPRVGGQVISTVREFIAGALARTLARVLKLPPETTRRIEIRHNYKVPMPDGVSLLADLYRPSGATAMPTVLVRSPYGRSGAIALIYARLLAKRGLQVLVQSCRGTFGSAGAIDPFHERDDGIATLDWIRRQPWHRGGLATAGASYLGITQWALLADAGPDLVAVAAAVSSSDPRDQTYPGGGFALELAAAWMLVISVQERPFALLRLLLQRSQLLHSINAWPLAGIDRAIVGRTVPFFQQWLTRSATDEPYWRSRVFHNSIPNIGATVDLVGGWYDIFLSGQVRDFHRLRQAGRRVHLTIGPWSHFSPGLIAEATRRAIVVLRAHLLPEAKMPAEAPVRVFVTGAGEWRELVDWPPPGVREQRWHLLPDGILGLDEPTPSTPDAYRYDPTNPTPALGGPMRLVRSVRDNALLERRSDVLTYTSAPLERRLEVLGTVTATVYFISSRQHTDLFVRLCDVDTRGVSRNVCDGLLRLSPERPQSAEGGTWRAEVELSPSAHCFERGHRLRVQVSSGAHPRFARNPGTGSSLHAASDLLFADQRVFHDPLRPSAIVLPVLEVHDALETAGNSRSRSTVSGR